MRRTRGGGLWEATAEVADAKREQASTGNDTIHGEAEGSVTTEALFSRMAATVTPSA